MPEEFVKAWRRLRAAQNESGEPTTTIAQVPPLLVHGHQFRQLIISHEVTHCQCPRPSAEQLPSSRQAVPAGTPAYGPRGAANAGWAIIVATAPLGSGDVAEDAVEGMPVPACIHA